MEPLVESISDTAKWVAFFRAEESERPDAVFHDPFARKLAGEKGEQIANAAKFSRNNSWSFVTRTFLFDHYVAQHLMLCGPAITAAIRVARMDCHEPYAADLGNAYCRHPLLERRAAD